MQHIWKSCFLVHWLSWLSNRMSLISTICLQLNRLYMISSFLDSWTLMTGPTGCTETSIRNYHCLLRNNQQSAVLEQNLVCETCLKILKFLTTFCRWLRLKTIWIFRSWDSSLYQKKILRGLSLRRWQLGHNPAPDSKRILIFS